MEKLPAPQNTPELFTILVVSSLEEDAAEVRQSLADPGWAVELCQGGEEALDHLREGRISVVLCEREFPSGNWQRLFFAAQSLERPPVFVVASPHADEHLWAEVLNVGGYDVLLKPFDRTELARVLRGAAKHWPSYSFRHSPDQSIYASQ